MLLTLRHDARRAGFVMPGPERLKKVPPYEYLAHSLLLINATQGGAWE